MQAHVSARTELPIVTLTDSSPGPRAPGSYVRLDDFFQGVGYVTLKLTSGCNLHCTYCNVDALTPHTPRMSIERFKQVTRLLLANSRQQRVGLEFHGGEPLLLADDWFAEAVEYARALATRHHKTVDFPLVTNGTLLTEERLLRLHALGIVFCLSADGPPQINDELRGGGAAVERALRLFRRHGIPCGILVVLSRANYSRMGEVMDWFADAGIDALRVNFLQPQGRGADRAQLLSGEEMFEGMRQVLDHMDRTGVQVREEEMLRIVDRFLRGREAQPRLTCWEFECQAGRTYCAIDHTGQIHACGTDLRNHPLGNIDADLDRASCEATLRRLHKKSDWVIRCFDCSARRICRHSCPTSDFNSETYKEHECRFTKLMHAHLSAYPENARRIDQALRGRHNS
jgi:radical SAM protein with 4Fe4S-binding SPASM domain